jgi:CDP-diacylglycerol--glycerol-3-phosphate 3-phosphatidyltransferase
MRIAPNFLTLFGFFLSALAAALFLFSNLLWAGVLLFIAGQFDILDGQVARRLNHRPRPFGAYLDSLADRFGEIVIFSSIFLKYFYLHSYFVSLLILWGLLSSLLVSYARARGQGVGVDPQTGLMPREARWVLLIAGCLLGHFLGDYLLFVAVAIIAILASFTVLQRLIYVYQRTD